MTSAVPDTGAHTAAGPEKSGRRIELSGSQVAGSAIATVVAAFLASSMGVYGTIIGAGLVSVGATAGGALIQHFFRRTGEQIRDVTQGAHVEPREQVRTSAKPRGQVRTSSKPSEHARTPAKPPVGEYGPGTVHGAPRSRRRGWRRVLLTAAAVFAVGMATVLGIETATGGTMAGWWGKDDGGGTTIGRVLDPGGGDTASEDEPAGSSSEPRDGQSPAQQPSGTPDPQESGGTAQDPEAPPSEGPDNSPAPTPSTGDGGDDPSTPAPTPSGDATDTGGTPSTAPTAQAE